MMVAKILQNVASVSPGMCVPFPGIDGVRAAVELQAIDRLAKRAIGDASLRTQFDEDTRLAHFDDRHRERNMTGPFRWAKMQRFLECARVVQRGKARKWTRRWVGCLKLQCNGLSHGLSLPRDVKSPLWVSDQAAGFERRLATCPK